MNTYANKIKTHLFNTISETKELATLFLRNPNRDFTRNRKLDFEKMLEILLTMGGKSLKLEIMDFFSFNIEMPTSSAFVQQRNKILPDAFKYIFHQFTKNTMDSFKTFNGYRLLAVDGSDLCISHNPRDKDNYFPNGPRARGFNLLHINALYDLCNRYFVDIEILQGRKSHERQALIDIVKRLDTSMDKAIVIADRGYENYNVFEYIKQKNLNFLIRVKDINSNGIASGLFLPDKGCFDIDYDVLATRRLTNEIKANPDKYKYMPQNQRFDFLPTGSKGTYPLGFRIVRFPITDDTYEVLITNLDRKDFPVEKLKEMYHMRWGIETAFRELKYAIGLVNLHSKKVDFIIQEIYARLTMYNFCEIITLNTVIEEKKGTKHTYQVNYTIAISICLHFIRYKGRKPPNVEALIAKNILPVRPGRKDPRKVKTKSTVSFLYRVA